MGAARELKRKLIREAAPLLDSPEEDVSLQSGRVVVGPSELRPAYYRTIAIGEVAAPLGDEGRIVAEYEFASEPPDMTSFCARPRRWRSIRRPARLPSSGWSRPTMWVPS